MVFSGEIIIPPAKITKNIADAWIEPTPLTLYAFALTSGVMLSFSYTNETNKYIINQMDRRGVEALAPVVFSGEMIL